jgi:hypothetical protein
MIAVRNKPLFGFRISGFCLVDVRLHPWVPLGILPHMQPDTHSHFLQSSALGAIAVSQAPAVLRAAQPDLLLRPGLIGCSAWETRCKVDWAPQREEIAQNSAASDLLKRPYRKPRKHPFQA